MYKFFSKLFFNQATSLIHVKDSELTLDKLLTSEEIIAKSNEDINSNFTLSDHSIFGILDSLSVGIKSLWVKSILLHWFSTLCAMLIPFFAYYFVNSLQTEQASANRYIFSTFIIISILLGALCLQHFLIQAQKSNQFIYSKLIKNIYEKIVTGNSKTLRNNELGRSINLLTYDAEILADSFLILAELLNSILVIIGSVVLLFYFAGYSTLGTVVALSVIIPATHFYSKRFVSLYKDYGIKRDRRFGIISQVISYVKQVKFLNWEKIVSNKIKSLRNEELKGRKNIAWCEVIWGLLYASTNTVGLLALFGTHYLLGEKLHLSNALAILIVFSILEDQIGGLSRFINRFFSVFVSGKRYNQLLNDLIIKKPNSFIANNLIDSKHDIIFEKVSVSNNNQDKSNLSLDLKVEKGQKIAVIGPIGAGKSKLLNLILNYDGLVEGRISLNQDSKISFCSQTPFIFQDSIRNNILFGETNVSDEKVLSALKLVSLQKEIDEFSAGINSNLGERGLNLSVGQKQRIQLARSIVINPDIILLDDPVSAVDSTTENEIYDKVIFGAWNKKTIVMTTHRLSQLIRFDKIIYISEDEVKFGNYSELAESSISFLNFVKKTNQNDGLSQLQVETMILSSGDKGKNTDGKFIHNEILQTGQVKFAHYFEYLSSLVSSEKKSIFLFFILGLVTFCYVALPLTQKLFLSLWLEKMTPILIITIFGCLAIATILIYFVHNIMWYLGSVKAGMRFHEKLLKSVLETKIEFFNKNPSGRILHRFSKDLEVIDSQLHWTLSNCIHSILTLIFYTIGILIALPVSIFFTVPTLFFYYLLQQKYRKTLRSLKRIESTARSPMITFLKECIEGAQVIKSSKNSHWFNQLLIEHLKKWNQFNYNQSVLNRWFLIRLSLIGTFVTGAVCLIVGFAVSLNLITTSAAVIAFLLSAEYWKILNWLVRVSSDLESKMVSVERLIEYSNLKNEEEKNNSFVADWPNHGGIQIKDLMCRYDSKSKWVINHFNLHILPKEKISIVGRTGSGKSTLLMTILKFVNFEGGEILIDGISIKDISVEQLRRNLSYVSQEPFFLSGSIRFNLDPENKYTEDQIQTALKHVNLDIHISNLRLSLDFEIDNIYSYFSQGQLQLLSIARILLMNTKIVLLDEVTSSLDIETEALLKQVFKKLFSDKTVIAINHRKTNLVNFDRIIELT